MRYAFALLALLLTWFLITGIRDMVLRWAAMSARERAASILTALLWMAITARVWRAWVLRW